MKVSNTIKTSVCPEFLVAIIVNYGNNKKSSKRLCLKYLKSVIESYCEIWIKLKHLSKFLLEALLQLIQFFDLLK